MKNKKLKINLFLLVVIGILASFTYNPTNAKFFKKSEPNEALTYSASFYQMGGYKILDNPDVNIVKAESTAGIIRYRYEFPRTKGMKDEEIDNYTLRDLPSACTNITFTDSATGAYSNDKSISFNYKNDSAEFVLNLACYVDQLINGDNIELEFKLDQQFTSKNKNDLIYEYYTVKTTITKESYFADKKDKLVGSEIYLIRSNTENVYGRFVDYLTVYLNQDTNFVNYLTGLTERNFDSLLTEYLGLTADDSFEDIKATVTSLGIGFSTTTDNGYNVFEITPDFKENFRKYFANKDYIFGNKVKLYNDYIEGKSVPQRLGEFLATQDNIGSEEIVPYIEKSLGVALSNSEISEYGKTKGLQYSDIRYNDIVTHGTIEIEPNFSSYVKTSKYNNATSSSPKNFYFYNTKLDDDGINDLFYEYLDEYLCNSYSTECKAVKKYIKDNLDLTTPNVIELANKLNSNQNLSYFNYDSSTHLLHITSDFYNIILNKKEITYEIPIYREAPIKAGLLGSKLDPYGYDSTVIEEILANNKIKEIFEITDPAEEINSGEILISVKVKNIIYNIKVEITSEAEYNFINITIIITEEISADDENNEDNEDNEDNEVITPPIDVPSDEVTEDFEKNPSGEATPSEPLEGEENHLDGEKEEEETEDIIEATDPTVDINEQTQDEIGIISYPITSSTDNTLGEEKKYMFIKPEDE